MFLLRMGGSAGAFGRLKRIAGLSKRRSPYVCRGCEATFNVQYHVCPECGSYSVERPLRVGRNDPESGGRGEIVRRER